MYVLLYWRNSTENHELNFAKTMLKAAASTYLIAPTRYYGFQYREASILGCRFSPSMVTSIHYYSLGCVESMVWTYPLTWSEKHSKNVFVLCRTTMTGSHVVKESCTILCHRPFPLSPPRFGLASRPPVGIFRGSRG